MNGPTLDTLTQHLDRPEWERHRLKRVGILAPAGIAAAGLKGLGGWK